MLVFVGNLLWLTIGFGWLPALAWFLIGLLWAITIVGLPIAFACWRISRHTLLPFGYQLIDARLVGERRIPGTMLVNFLWILFGGLWLAIGHALHGLALCLTVVGIPFGLAHFKLAQACFAPLGKRIVPADVSQAIRLREIARQIA